MVSNHHDSITHNKCKKYKHSLCEVCWRDQKQFHYVILKYPTPCSWNRAHISHCISLPPCYLPILLSLLQSQTHTDTKTGIAYTHTHTHRVYQISSLCNKSYNHFTMSVLSLTITPKHPRIFVSLFSIPLILYNIYMC